MNTKCSSIEKDGVLVIDGDGNSRRLEADTVVLAAGMKSRSEIREAFRDTAFDIIAIGDCVKPRNVHDAVAEGYNASMIQ